MSSHRLMQRASAVAAGLVLMMAGWSSAFAAQMSGWSYTVARHGAWVADTVNPGEHVLADGDATGWAFGALGSTSPSAPRAPANFSDLCSTSARSIPRPADVRVAVVIDAGAYATAASGDNPAVACLTLPRGATATAALDEAAASVRYAGMLVCAVNGVPSAGCFDEHQTASTPAPSEAPAGGSAGSGQSQIASPAQDSAAKDDGARASAAAADALVNTPRAWLLGGGLLLLAIGLAAAGSPASAGLWSGARNADRLRRKAG